jgi:hypothetical protein
MQGELIQLDAQGHVLKLSQLQFGKREYKSLNLETSAVPATTSFLKLATL